MSIVDAWIANVEDGSCASAEQNLQFGAERISDTDDLPHYGGIYSCNQGNIALNPSEKECSVGYSAHVMGTIEENCLLFVCLKFEDFRKGREMPPIALPPFFSIPLSG